MPESKTSFVNVSMPNVWTSKGKLFMGDKVDGLPEEEVEALEAAQKAYVAKARERAGANKRSARNRVPQ